MFCLRPRDPVPLTSSRSSLDHRRSNLSGELIKRKQKEENKTAEEFIGAYFEKLKNLITSILYFTKDAERRNKCCAANYVKGSSIIPLITKQAVTFETPYTIAAYIIRYYAPLCKCHVETLCHI